MVAQASLDDWGPARRALRPCDAGRAAKVLLDDLSADLGELKRTIQRHRSSSAMRRLTRVAAQMSGLMCLTLCKLDDRAGFRRWTRMIVFTIATIYLVRGGVLLWHRSA